MRQTAIHDRLSNRKAHVVTLARDYPSAGEIPLHFHDRDQLVYASRGVMTVRTGLGTWVVPPQRAVWIPAAVPHTISMSGNVAMRTLYLKCGLAPKLPRTCCVVNVPPLLKELILHACTLPALNRTVHRQRHLVDIIIDQLAVIQMIPLQLPHASDARACRVMDKLLADPSDRHTLSQLCKAAGASKRTIERLFLEQVGMTFGRWRQQLRLMQGVRLLAQGAKVSHAALEAGYNSPSAFIAVFRKALGTTPALYFAKRKKYE